MAARDASVAEVKVLLSSLLKRAGGEPSRAMLAAERVRSGATMRSGLTVNETFFPGWYVVLSLAKSTRSSRLLRLVMPADLQSCPDHLTEIEETVIGDRSLIGGEMQIKTSQRERAFGEKGECLTGSELQEVVETARGILSTEYDPKESPMLQPPPIEFPIPLDRQVRCSKGTICCGKLLQEGQRHCPDCGKPRLQDKDSHGLSPGVGVVVTHMSMLETVLVDPEEVTMADEAAELSDFGIRPCVVREVTVQRHAEDGAFCPHCGQRRPVAE